EEDRAILKKKIDKDDAAKIELELPEAGSYPVRIKGSFRLHVPRETPLAFGASYKNPVWINYSGPHYFYVPKGTEQIIFSASPRLSLIVPGKGRRDFSSADRAKGKNYVALDVPEGADGRVWRTMNQTRGNVRLINIPPYMSFYPDRIVVPKEIAEKDNVKLGWSEFQEER
ncbi:MAG: hypothetical protein KGZ25_07910, partial [Planctomycetes bacterium]|nr:hypothetical protein [Planctomycetota bacterium]